MRRLTRGVGFFLVPWLCACGEERASDELSPGEPSGAETVVGSSKPIDPATPGPESARTELVNPGLGGQSTGENSDRTENPTSLETRSLPDASTFILGTTVVGSRCDRAERIGALGVNLSSDRTIISGSVSNGTLPASVPQVTAEAGECQLLVPRDLFCSSCASNQACAGNEECISKPAKVSAGALQVEGMLEPVEVMPNGITLDYSKTVLDPYPAYEVGARIDVHAAGDVVEAFGASMLGVPRLTTEQTVVLVRHGESASLQWNTTGVESDQSAVFVSFSVNVHGAVTGWIECTVPDTGAFDIPAELVSDLMDLGLSGFPRVDIERRSSATADLSAGCVDVYIGSKLTMDIEVEGLVSCNDDTNCEEGQTCSPELACE